MTRAGAGKPSRMLVDPDDLVTLADASARLGKPRSYFRVREFRARARGRPFPDPVATIGGAAVFLLADLVAWDLERLEGRSSGSSDDSAGG